MVTALLPTPMNPSTATLRCKFSFVVIYKFSLVVVYNHEPQHIYFALERESNGESERE